MTGIAPDSNRWICDARVIDRIEESLVSVLVQLWPHIKGVPHYVFVNRDRSMAYLGIGNHDCPSNTLPVFIAHRFDKTRPGVEIRAKILVKTSISMWPEIEVMTFVRDKETTRLVRHIQELSWIVRDMAHLIPQCINPEDTGLDRSEYFEAVKKCRALKKIVLSRRVTHTMASPDMNPFALLLQVMRQTAHSDAGKRYVVGLTVPGDGSFVSVTPERMCRIDNDCRIETEALAGTCKGSEFKMTAKLDEEHALVRDYIKECLGRFSGGSSTVIVGEREYVNLRDMTHCRQKLSCESYGFTGYDLMSQATAALHPTPAVGGIPAKTAVEKILELEKFDRKFFASPIGIYDPTSRTGEMCVGLRSAHVYPNGLVYVYAGAGVVAQSDPAEEWDEMETKMSQYTDILKVNKQQPPISCATEAQSKFVIEELVRQNVSHFLICPGSRSTPLTVAVRRNPVAHERSRVIHDERCAGFMAVGVARAGGLAVVIATSGTAVANLLPAVCEAREAGLAIIVVSADRPSRSWNVGEFQTVPQESIFARYVGFQKSFPAPCSEAGIFFASTLLVSVLADISFAVGDIAKRRNQSVHFNFEFEKSELQPQVVVGCEQFGETFIQNLHPRLRQYSQHLDVFTHYIQETAAIESSSIPDWVSGSILAGKCLIVCGELRDPRDSIALGFFSSQSRVYCIAECLSLLPGPSEYILLSADQILADDELRKRIASQVEVVIRIGGPLISGRLQDLASSMGRVIRVYSDGFASTRHDPQYSAEVYMHSTVRHFLSQLSGIVSPKSEDHFLANLFRTIPDLYRTSLEEMNPQWNEAMIAHIVSSVVMDGAIFLSASMPCRDYALYGSLQRSNHPYVFVGANRGANGIDGVVSAATGYASETGMTTYVVLGDVATLHDLSGVAMALNISPGSVDLKGPDVRVVCVNNSGGAIFSFLPIRKYNDVFTPYFDTPHEMRFADIVNGMKAGCAVAVSDVESLRSALRTDRFKFIECVGLPSHDENVDIHKALGALVISGLVAPR